MWLLALVNCIKLLNLLIFNQFTRPGKELLEDFHFYNLEDLKQVGECNCVLVHEYSFNPSLFCSWRIKDYFPYMYLLSSVLSFVFLVTRQGFFVPSVVSGKMKAILLVLFCLFCFVSQAFGFVIGLYLVLSNSLSYSFSFLLFLPLLFMRLCPPAILWQMVKPHFNIPKSIQYMIESPHGKVFSWLSVLWFSKCIICMATLYDYERKHFDDEFRESSYPSVMLYHWCNSQFWISIRKEWGEETIGTADQLINNCNEKKGVIHNKQWDQIIQFQYPNFMNVHTESEPLTHMQQLAIVNYFMLKEGAKGIRLILGNFLALTMTLKTQQHLILLDNIMTSMLTLGCMMLEADSKLQIKVVIIPYTFHILTLVSTFFTRYEVSCAFLALSVHSIATESLTLFSDFASNLPKGAVKCCLKVVVFLASLLFSVYFITKKQIGFSSDYEIQSALEVCLSNENKLTGKVLEKVEEISPFLA